MYRDFYGMSNLPFVRDIEPGKLYESVAMQESLSRLRYVAARKMFAVVSGDSGCGKSTMLRKFAYSLPHGEYEVLYVSDSKLTPTTLYKRLLSQLGVESGFKRCESKDKLHQEVAMLKGAYDKKVVCILDEAHLLDKATLEEFRFLLNCDYDSKSPMAVVLSGQTELWDTKLKTQRYAAIRQRIDLNCVLPHLDRSETGKYIQAHMEYAGCPQQIFTDGALDVIYTESSGIMRLINRICERCLMYGCQQGKRLIDDHIVRYVVENEGVN